MELVLGDALDYDSLVAAAQGCFAAFYLVHSMPADPRHFRETDRRAAKEAGLDRSFTRVAWAVPLIPP